MKIENQRMLDLLRVCRAELFTKHHLIDEEEYAWFAGLPSRETHARLKDYDTLRATVAAGDAQIAALQQSVADTAQAGKREADGLRAELDATRGKLTHASQEANDARRLKNELRARNEELVAALERIKALKADRFIHGVDAVGIADAALSKAREEGR